MFKGNFIENLPKIYGMYTGGFIVFIILMAILEGAGLGADTIGILFVIFTVVIYAAIGWLSRTMQVVGLLCRRTRSAARVQRHGDRGRLDVRRVLRGAGRRHLFRRTRLSGLRCRLDRPATCW